MRVPSLPDRRTVDRALRRALEALDGADPAWRPTDGRGKPGGLVRLPSVDYTVIVPDLHARGDFLRAALAANLSPGGATVEEDLREGRAALVCVGDAFHAESRARDRWRKAYREFLSGYDPSPAMGEEMTESLDVLIEVARCQSSYPDHFHFLKGNHENVANEGKEGNFPFRKFAYEGDMVREWILRALGQRVFDQIYRWEKALPLAAVGDGFLITHAEPPATVTPDDVVNAYLNPDIIAALTWTDNGQADPGSVAGTLLSFFPTESQSLLFGGHRPVAGRYALRQDGRYVQINTPDRWVVGVVTRVEDFDPTRDVIDLNELGGGHG